METVTIYKDSYQDLLDNEFKMITDLAELRGSIRALAEMEDSPEFVFKKLKELVQEF